MMIGRNAIFGIGKPTEMIGSKNQRTTVLRDIATPSATPPTAAIDEAGQRAVEREPEIDPQVAADGVGLDARHHGAERRQHERRHLAAAREQLPGDQQHQDREDAGADAEHGIEALARSCARSARLGRQRRLVFYSRHRSTRCISS